MATIIINITDTFDEWRLKTNSISSSIGDVTVLATTDKSSLVNAINEIFADIDGNIPEVVVGSSTFAGLGAEVTIPHGLDSTPNFANVVAISNPAGDLGEVWVRKDATNIYVGNSGAHTGSFSYRIEL